ncbi:MAG TPA: hypothetical protein VEC37_11860 [Bacillota bacterium]|nr:hypothetical protein [Bacillota bacterium]
MNPFLIKLNGFRRWLRQNRLTQIHELLQRGIEGDQEAVRTAYESLTGLRQIYPGDQLIEAYYGSILTLMGRDAVDPMQRLQYVRQGLKVLDEAVKNDPDQVMIRSLRGYVCFRLPEVFFHRTGTSVEDFSYLVARYEREPGVISEEFYNRLLKDLASANKTLSKSEKAKEKSAKEGDQE